MVASSVPHTEILEFVERTLDPGFPLTLIETTGDIRPNGLLRDGDADANFFQHVPYLRAEEAQLGVSLAVIAAVHVEPLGIYSRRLKTLEAVPREARVALPNNVPNFSWGLKLLEASGLIRLHSGGDGTLATVQDIAGNQRDLRFVEVASAQLPRSLDDVDVAVINSNYALESGLDPARIALALERAEGNPYANVLVTTQALAQDERILRLASLLTSAEVAGFISERCRSLVIHGRRA